MKQKEVAKTIAEVNPNAIIAEGFDDCIIGICQRFGQPSLIAYDRQKVIQKLQDRDGKTPEAAEEFFEFNIIGAWAGPCTPVFLTLAEDFDQTKQWLTYFYEHVDLGPADGDIRMMWSEEFQQSLEQAVG